MTDARTTQFMQDLAAGIDDLLNRPGKRETGFVLLVFPFNQLEGARTNYVSNGQRVDILSALKEIVARFEGQAESKAGHA